MGFRAHGAESGLLVVAAILGGQPTYLLEGSWAAPALTDVKQAPTATWQTASCYAMLCYGHATAAEKSIGPRVTWQ